MFSFIHWPLQIKSPRFFCAQKTEWYRLPLWTPLTSDFSLVLASEKCWQERERKRRMRSEYLLSSLLGCYMLAVLLLKQALTLLKCSFPVTSCHRCCHRCWTHHPGWKGKWPLPFFCILVSLSVQSTGRPREPATYSSQVSSPLRY